MFLSHLTTFHTLHSPSSFKILPSAIFPSAMKTWTMTTLLGGAGDENGLIFILTEGMQQN